MSEATILEKADRVFQGSSAYPLLHDLSRVRRVHPDCMTDFEDVARAYPKLYDELAALREQVAGLTKERDEAKSFLEVENWRADAAEQTRDKLRAAITAAGFGVMETSGAWSIHDVSNRAEADAEREREYVRESIEEIAALTASRDAALAAQADAERERDEAKEVVMAAENYIRCVQSPGLSPYIRENGRHGSSPWAELCDATKAARPNAADSTADAIMEAAKQFQAERDKAQQEAIELAAQVELLLAERKQ